ncbi:unnamed protein product [Heligmosomoides polygyrus]|uniref:Endo/exonuclease/phosphatase domain-containing protein n=1 Tax=Heligmosomoides polygyrus TaxID=6339 RepID=A0A183FQE2_HELPZ|nr:unnamed protein product [Heligmosomoides polygyrus]
MDSLLLLCRVDAFLVRGSGMFMYSVRGCVRSDCNCVGPDKSWHSVELKYIYNARTRASKASVEDLMMRARKIKYDVIGLTETRRHHPYTPPTTQENNCSSGYATAGDFDCIRRECPDDEEIEAFYVELEKFYKEDHTFYKVIVGDSNAKIGPRRSPEELHIGIHEASSLRWAWESSGGQFHNEIDHIIFNRKYCLTDDSVVPKFTASFARGSAFRVKERRPQSSGR